MNTVERKTVVAPQLCERCSCKCPKCFEERVIVEEEKPVQYRTVQQVIEQPTHVHTVEFPGSKRINYEGIVEERENYRFYVSGTKRQSVPRPIPMAQTGVHVVEEEIKPQKTYYTYVQQPKTITYIQEEPVTRTVVAPEVRKTIIREEPVTRTVVAPEVRKTIIREEPVEYITPETYYTEVPVCPRCGQIH